MRNLRILTSKARPGAFPKLTAKRAVGYLAALSIIALGAPSCDDDDDGGTRPVERNSALRALHLSPDAPAVDIFLNQSAAPAVSNLSFPNGTVYLDVPEGTYDLDIAPAGGTYQDAVLSVSDLALDVGYSYTAVAYNTLNQISALALIDNYANLAAGNLRVRAIHTAAGVGEVDIWNVTDAQNPAPLYVDFEFAEIGAYLDLPAGAYSLGFDVDNDAIPDLVFTLPALPAGTVANVFAVADQGGTVFLLAQFADGTTARIDAS
jgi:hypothetical protein